MTEASYINQLLFWNDCRVFKSIALLTSACTYSMDTRLISLWRLWITVHSFVMKCFAYHYTRHTSWNLSLELYTNQRMLLTFISMILHICMIIHKHTSTNLISEVCILYHGIKLQHLAMFFPLLLIIQDHCLGISLQKATDSNFE